MIGKESSSNIPITQHLFPMRSELIGMLQRKKLRNAAFPYKPDKVPIQLTN